MEKKIYGVARISTPKQKLERQVRNILNAYPDAYVIQIKYTGTTFKGNKQMENLVCQIKKDVKDNKEVLLVFDEVYLIPIIICSFADLISSLVILTVSEA